MKISYDWLKRYLPELRANGAELEVVFPKLGFEVESVIYSGLGPLPGVVVGEVMEKNRHPDADRLSVCRVRVGGGDDDILQIVCGATNFKVGDKVPVARVGAVLPGDFRIKESKLRGVVSMGMMCSAKELGLGIDQAGLMILAGDLVVGTGINEVFPEASCTFDLELTANRGDCASHIGVARELSAYYGISLIEGKVMGVGEDASGSFLESVGIESEGCVYYSAYSIKGVKVGPSPEWLRRDIEAVGLRSVNNIVDITNWVLFDSGQPLHVFDFDKIRGGKVVVRHAKEGEVVKTLDEKERVLDGSMTVVADGEKVLAIGGVMGLMDSGVDEGSKDIILEAAYFRPAGVRATAKRLNLHTDGSYRFSRGVDPLGVEVAALRAVELIIECAGGEVVGVDRVGALPYREVVVDFDPGYLQEVIGFEIGDEQAIKALKGLGFEVDAKLRPWKVKVPSFRVDVHRAIDVVEEILRLHGTDNIPAGRLVSATLGRGPHYVASFKGQVADYLAANGFFETYHYSLVSGGGINGLWNEGFGEFNRIENPLTGDHTHFRGSLLPGLIEALKYNHANKVGVSKLFEIGHVIRGGSNGKVSEFVAVGVVMVGGMEEVFWKDMGGVDYYGVKKLMMHVADLAGVDMGGVFEASADEEVWQKGQAGSLGGVSLGMLNLKMTRSKDIPYPVFAGEIIVRPEMIRDKKGGVKFKGFETFPSSRKDLALVMDGGLGGEVVRRDVEKWAVEAAPEGVIVGGVSIFDVYSGGGVGEGRKSIGFSIEYRGEGRTLKEGEIMGAFDGLQEVVRKDGRFQIRA